MSKFSYEAIDSQGNYLKGNIEADSKDEAIKLLTENSYYVKSIRKNIDIKFSQKVDSKTKSQFFYKLASILESGVPLLRGMELIVSQLKNNTFKNVINEIIKSLKDGNTLSDSLSKHQKIFSNMTVQQIRAGELGSNIEDVLLEISQQYENENRIKKSVQSALFYPSIILLLGIAMISIMIFKVIPVLKEAFASIDGELPALTKFVISVTGNFEYYLIGMIIFIILMTIFGVAVKKNEKWSYQFDKYLLKVPVIGKGIYYFQTYIFCKILGSLISIGMPVNEVFTVLKDTVKNKYILKGVVQSKDEIERDGLALSEVIARSGVFYDEFVQLILIGEESGGMPEMLAFLAKQSQEELDNILKTATNLISPLILSFVLVVVGFILIAMMLPVFSLINQI